MYKIKITKITEEPYTRKEYEKIADTGNKEDGKSVYGYVTTEDIREVENEILRQEVEEIDLKSILKAINNL